MPIELFVPIGIFLFGMFISDISSSAAIRLVEEHRASGK
jgi:hypothetical protein